VRTVDLLVQRSYKLRKRASTSPVKQAADEGLRRHAGVTTNLGGLLFNAGEYVTAMRLFQESVQTLMLLEEESPRIRPSKERQQEMSQLVSMLGAETNTAGSRNTFIAITKKLVERKGEGELQPVPGTEKVPPTVPSILIPCIYGHDSHLKGTERRELAGLVFNEPFRITVNEDRDTCEHFIIPLAECSKATLFNMGLTHYHWGNTDTAMQFFDLASSLSQQLSPLAFDPVVLASYNNMAQIHLQLGRSGDAMELLKDALARGNAALASLYAGEKDDWRPTDPTDERDSRRSRRLRRKLARTVVNLGHVHFINCEYDAAMTTCHDALRLLHTNTEDAELAAVWHNIAILHYHKGAKSEALLSFDKFLARAKGIIGSDHLQVAEAMHQKGVILLEMGKLYDSMIPMNEALRIRRFRLGKDHTSVAESLCHIGKVLVSREEYDFGLNAYLEGIAVYRKLAGGDGLSFDVAQNLLDVGRAFQVQGRLSESIRTYEEVTELTKKVFGERHPFVARLNNIVGNLCLEAGSIDTSMEKFGEAVRILTENDIPFDLKIVQDPLCRVVFTHHPMASMA
jgi:tetratricopeptide (TPR) repeat protein